MATTYYNIPTLNATDTIDLVNDINSMMTTIDTTLHSISSGDNPEIDQLQTDVSQLQSSVETLQSTITALQSTINNYVKITTYGDLDSYGAITTKEA